MKTNIRVDDFIGRYTVGDFIAFGHYRSAPQPMMYSIFRTERGELVAMAHDDFPRDMEHFRDICKDYPEFYMWDVVEKWVYAEELKKFKLSNPIWRQYNYHYK